MRIIRRSRILIRKARNQEKAVCCAAAGTAVLPSAFATIRFSAASGLAFVLPEVTELRSGCNGRRTLYQVITSRPAAG